MRSHTIGDVIYPAGGQFETSNLGCYQLFVMGSGSCQVTAAGRKFSCLPDDVFMMFPDTHYLLQFDKKTESEHYWVSLFDCAHLLPKLRMLNSQSIAISQQKVFLDFMKLCIGLRNTAGLEHAEFPLVSQFFETYTDFYLGMDGAKKGMNSKVLAALNYLRVRFNEPLNLTILAAQVHCTPEHLSRLFRKSDLSSPMKCLRELRLNKASYLIKETSLSFKEIGYQVGIPDQFQFSRAIKSRFGHSPKQLRHMV